MIQVISKIISDFKASKTSVKALEEKLKFSNGMLGKAAKGVYVMSQNKYEKLISFHAERFPDEVVTIKDLIESLKPMEFKENGVYIFSDGNFKPYDCPQINTVETKRVEPAFRKPAILYDFTYKKEITQPISEQSSFDAYMDEILEANSVSECEGISKSAKNDHELSFKQKEFIKLKCIEKSQKLEF